MSAYVKLLFWTDSGNILGIVPPFHPNSEGKLRLVVFPGNDYPNSWAYAMEIQDETSYHVTIVFTPSSGAVAVGIGGIQVAQGTLSVDMLAATNGPQFGVYSFDYGSQSWADSGFQLWLNDVCIGETSGTCPSCEAEAGTVTATTLATTISAASTTTPATTSAVPPETSTEVNATTTTLVTPTSAASTTPATTSAVTQYTTTLEEDDMTDGASLSWARMPMVFHLVAGLSLVLLHA